MYLQEQCLALNRHLIRWFLIWMLWHSFLFGYQISIIENRGGIDNNGTLRCLISTVYSKGCHVTWFVGDMDLCLDSTLFCEETQTQSKHFYKNLWLKLREKTFLPSISREMKNFFELCDFYYETLFLLLLMTTKWRVIF